MATASSPEAAKSQKSFVLLEDKDKMIKLKSLVPEQFAPNPTYLMMVNIYPTYIYTLSHTELILYCRP